LLTADVLKSGGGSAFHYRGDLLILDVSNPENITIKKRFRHIMGGLRMGIAGDFFLIIDQVGMLHVVDRTKDFYSGDVGSYRLPAEQAEIAVANNFIYVSARSQLEVLQLPWN